MPVLVLVAAGLLFQQKEQIVGLISFLFGTTDRYERLNARTIEEVNKGRPSIKENMCGGQWERSLSEQGSESHCSQEETKDEGGKVGIPTQYGVLR